MMRKRRRYTPKEIEKLKILVQSGKSYGEIFRKFGIPKSTLSTWFGKHIRRPITHEEMLANLAKIRPGASAAISKKYKNIRDGEDIEIEKNVAAEVQGFPHQSIVAKKSFIAMLYWAEGAKHARVSGLTFTNTDPALLKLFITLLRECYEIDETKFSIKSHIHYYHNPKKVVRFWSNMLEVAENQFQKPYRKSRKLNRKRFRKNYAGICAIYYRSSRIRKEIMALASLLEKDIINQYKKRP